MSSFLIDRWSRRGRSDEDEATPANPWSISSSMSRLYVQPLFQAAVVGSLLTGPFFFIPRQGQLLELGLYATWLAVLWLQMAIKHRKPLLFLGFQISLHGAALYV